MTPLSGRLRIYLVSIVALAHLDFILIAPSLASRTHAELANAGVAKPRPGRVAVAYVLA